MLCFSFIVFLVCFLGIDNDVYNGIDIIVIMNWSEKSGVIVVYGGSVVMYYI